MLTAQVIIASGAPGTAVVWSSSDPGVASVSDDGEVSANAPGSAMVTATSAVSSTHRASATISVVAASIVDTVAASDTHETLHMAMDASALAGTLADADAGPYTVLAPTDAAFAALLSDVGLAPGDLLDHPELDELVAFHVIEGRFLVSDLLTRITQGGGATAMSTLHGATVTFTFDGTHLVLDGAVRLDPTDIVASNGVIHVTDGALQPPGFTWPTDLVTATLLLEVTPASGGTVRAERDGSLLDLDDQATLEPGDRIVLTAEPATGWVFADWTGACIGGADADTLCTLVLAPGRNEVRARFHDTTDLVPSASASLVDTDPALPQAWADGEERIEIRVVVRNASGLPLEGVNVVLDAVTGPTVAPADRTLRSGPDGRVVFSVSSAESGQFGFGVAADGVRLDASAVLTFAAPLQLAGYGDISVVIDEQMKLDGARTGGLAPFTFTRSGDPLPPGVTFLPLDGAIAGVTTQRGTFSGTVTVEDALGQTASRDYRLVVRHPTPVWHTSGQTTAQGFGSSATVPWPSLAQLRQGDLVVVVVTTLGGGISDHDVGFFDRIDIAGSGSSPHVSAWFREYPGPRPRPGGGHEDIEVFFLDDDESRSGSFHVVATRVTGHDPDRFPPTGPTRTFANGQANGNLIPLDPVATEVGSLLVGIGAHVGTTTMTVPDEMTQASTHHVGTGEGVWEATMAIATEERPFGGAASHRLFRGPAGGRGRAGLMFTILPPE